MGCFIACLLATGLLSEASAQDPREGAGGIVAAPGFYIVLGAPEGWIFEAETALKTVGARVVIYPVGTDLDHTQAMIRLNFFPLEGLTLNQWLKKDIEATKEEFPGIKITDHASLLTADSVSAVVEGFSPGESCYTITERMAYLEVKGHVVIVWLSAGNEVAFKEALGAFEYVVSKMRILKPEDAHLTPGN